MPVRNIVLGASLILFLAQTAIVLGSVGYLGFFAAVNLNHATRLMFLDLVITLTLIAAWMWKDAAARGRAIVPYLILTFLFGSAGPLLYLLLAPARSEVAHA